MGEIDLDFAAAVFTRIGALEARCEALQERVVELEARPPAPDLRALAPLLARFLEAAKQTRASLIDNEAEAHE